MNVSERREPEREGGGKAVEGEADNSLEDPTSATNLQVKQVNVKELEGTFHGAAPSLLLFPDTQVPKAADPHLLLLLFYFLKTLLFYSFFLCEAICLLHLSEAACHSPSSIFCSF
jgi:hypothetical protein